MDLREIRRGIEALDVAARRGDISAVHRTLCDVRNQLADAQRRAGTPAHTCSGPGGRRQLLTHLDEVLAGPDVDCRCLAYLPTLQRHLEDLIRRHGNSR